MIVAGIAHGVRLIFECEEKLYTIVLHQRTVGRMSELVGTSMVEHSYGDSIAEEIQELAEVPQKFTVTMPPEREF